MSIIGKAKVCQDKDQKKDIPNNQCTTFKEKDCCSNQTIVKEGDDTFKKSNIKVENETLVFINTLFYNYISLFKGQEKNAISFQAYRPPLLFTDIIILNETFLI
nr:hypothetical protein [Bizionia saleffrena]